MAKKPNIEAAFSTYARMVIPASAPRIQHDECRQAFIAGAATLFYAIMDALEPGEEPTEADLSLFDELQKYFTAYGATLDAKVFERLRKGMAQA